MLTAQDDIKTQFSSKSAAAELISTRCEHLPCDWSPLGMTLTSVTSVPVPDFGHHQAMLHHQCVTYGRHHGENLLAGRVPPHQVQQSVCLLLSVQLVDTLLRDQLHRYPTVVLEKQRRCDVESCRSVSVKTNLSNDKGCDERTGLTSCGFG